MSRALPPTSLAQLQDEWQRDRDRLAPCGQDPLDDHLEHAEPRSADHAPVFQPPAGVEVEQPTARERAEHAARLRRGTPWTVCECGGWEKGYRHPGHQMRCPRWSSRDERAGT